MIKMQKDRKKELLKNSKLSSMSKVFQALSEPMRIKILQILGKHELCACEFVEFLGISQSTVSYHISILSDAGLIRTQREGRKIICNLRKEGFVKQLFETAESLAR